MQESLNGISLDGSNHRAMTRKELALQRGMQMESSMAGAGSIATSALGYEPQDVHAMIQEREKNFFNEISLNPQLKGKF